MDTTELERAVTVRRAALRVVALHPGVVGQILARELFAYSELGGRFGPSLLLERLVREVLDAPAPGAGRAG